MAATTNAETSATPTAAMWRTGRLIKAGIVCGVAVVIAGGYAGSWKWTGFTSNSSLWDWLHLALLPVTFGTLPLWLHEHKSVGRARTGAITAGVALFVVLVALGYGFDWTWTGFPGNTLWNWLELLVLPAVIVAWPVLEERNDRLGPKSISALSGAGAALLVFVIAGYEYHWTWTGFPGNTLWDWLQLLLLPVILPWWVLPSLARWMTVEIEANKNVLEAGGLDPAISEATEAHRSPDAAPRIDPTSSVADKHVAAETTDQRTDFRSPTNVKGPRD